MKFLEVLQSLGCNIGLNKKAWVEESDDESVYICKTDNRIKLSKEFLILKPYIMQISQSPAAFSAITDKILENHSFMVLPLFYSLIAFLDAKGLLTYSIPGILDVNMLSEYTFRTEKNIEADTEYKLSRFTFIRREKGGIRMETALNPVIVKVYDIGLINILFDPDGINLVKDTYGNDRNGSKIQAALRLLYMFLFVSDSNEEDDSLRQWEFHDLLLHGRSRYGRHTKDYGATYRFQKTIKCLPPVKEPPVDVVPVMLYKPDIEAVKTQGSSFFDVIEKRYSARKFESKPITLKQLGKLLYLTSRVKSFGFDTFHEISKRPYPSGGSIYELEIYITALNCDGLAKGLYYYDPVKHSLYIISEITPHVQKMVLNAQGASKCKELQVLLTISARFPRVSWKYEAIAYSLILKNTGVLLQNISLAATAMDIGSCILGSGDSDALSEVLGKKFYEEAAVGEMILGTIRGE
ncbi:MAG: SagB family peptide dehydrogenase [Clostridia bacterium]|nr:SagB family peptide dehydrogenase [Clostridia bacterium]